MIDVREAVSNDLPVLSRLYVLCWKRAYPSVLDKSLLDRISLEDATSFWETVLESSNDTLFLAFDGSAIVGFVCVSPCRREMPPEVGEISSCYVHPEYQGKGLGKQLFSLAAQALRDAGYAKAALWVFEANWPARHFFSKLGYCKVGQSRYVKGFAVNEVCYLRNLMH